jgi:drug/metabolite transporter (DMT)-like permease
MKKTTTPPPEIHSTHRRAVLWMTMTTLLWGGSFVFNKIGFRELPPLTFLALRFLLATLLMGMVCLRRLRLFDMEILRKGVTVGTALALTNISFVLGVSGTTVSRAGFFNNLFVLLVPVICFVLWRERVDRVTSAGICLASAGLWFLARGGSEGFSRGDAISLLCAVFIAIHIITVSRVLGDEDVYLVSLVQFATVALIGTAAAGLFSPPLHHFGAATVGAVVYCAVFPTVISFTLQNRWQRCATPAQAGLIYTLDPLWSLLGGCLILGERLTAEEWIGCALIFAGVIIPPAATRMLERRYFALLRRQATGQ